MGELSGFLYLMSTSLRVDVAAVYGCQCVAGQGV